MLNIFTPRKSYKPFEYPGALAYTELMQKSFWVHTEVDFTADIHDFKTQLTSAQQEVIKRALLAIAQIEVDVKGFWRDLHIMLPKPEFNGLGTTFAECEFRHSEAYSRLLEVLGYTNEFETILEVPAIKARLEFIKSAMQNSKSGNHKEYIKALIAFTILVENVSLFSQFATILYFCRFEGIMKNVANIIAWTSVDEQTHANAGIWIIQQIFAEDPDFLDRNDVNDIIAIVKESIDIESDVLDWIFETGEFPTMSKADLIAYMKQRLNDSLRQLQYVPIVFTDYETANASNLKWFEEEIFANSLDDFFAKRPVDYTKHDKPVTENDLF